MGYIGRILERVEQVRQVDSPARAVQRWLNRLLPDDRPVVDTLSGAWLGHPLHPVLALVPVGSWLSAEVLDTVPGAQPAARKLVLAGLVAAAPTALAGATDFRKLDPRQRRVGFLHWAATATAGGCYVLSYRHRRRGRWIAGRFWGLAGLAAVSTAALLGGHLTYALGAGVYRWQPERQPTPAGGPAAPAGAPAAAGRPVTPAG